MDRGRVIFPLAGEHVTWRGPVALSGSYTTVLTSPEDLLETLQPLRLRATCMGENPCKPGSPRFVLCIYDRLMGIEFYASAGPFTELTAVHAALVQGLGLDALGLCRVAQGLLVAPPNASGAGMDERRLAERNMRPASALLERALELGPSLSPTDLRPAEQRVVGTCRHYAVLATAFLRAVNIPARARCGFAAYFFPPKKVDHWIIEYWPNVDRGWIRVDPEYLDRATPSPSRTEDLRPGEFLTAGEAWQLVRTGRDDPANFGVFGTENWGPGEIRGNAMRDIASLAKKLEMLPWDEWGPMTDSYKGATGEDFDRLIDELAVATNDPNGFDLTHIYDRLAIPATLLH